MTSPAIRGRPCHLPRWSTLPRVSVSDRISPSFGDNLFPLALDVTDRAADFEAVVHARRHFGRLEIVVNNAGYGLFGAIEETSEAEARAEIETKLFGRLWITRSPTYGGQGSGHIVQVFSMRGVVAFLTIGIYHASKWDPEATGEAVLAIVDAEERPLRVFLGAPPLQFARNANAQRLSAWNNGTALPKPHRDAEPRNPRVNPR